MDKSDCSYTCPRKPNDVSQEFQINDQLNVDMFIHLNVETLVPVYNTSNS